MSNRRSHLRPASWNAVGPGTAALLCLCGCFEELPPEAERPAGPSPRAAATAPAEPARAASASAGAASEPESVLDAGPGGAVENNPDPPGESLEKLDLASLSAGGIRAGFYLASQDRDLNRAALMDGDPGTAATSDEPGPLVLSLAFRQPTAVRSLRLHPAEPGTYDWSVRGGAGGPLYAITGVPAGRWSRLDLPQPVPASTFTVEVSRPDGGGPIGVGEIEAYVEKRP